MESYRMELHRLIVRQGAELTALHSQLAQVERERDDWINRDYRSTERAEQAEQERDEAQRSMGKFYDEWQEAMAEMVKLLAENRLLGEAVISLCKSEGYDYTVYFDDAPLTAAEVERVKWLEEVERAAQEWIALRLDWSGEDLPEEMVKLQVAWDNLYIALSGPALEGDG